MRCSRKDGSGYRCNREAAPGYKRCWHHIRLKRAENKRYAPKKKILDAERHQRFKTQGLCKNCGKPKAGRSRCKQCLDSHKAYFRRLRAGVETSRHALRTVLQDEELYREYLERGLL